MTDSVIAESSIVDATAADDATRRRWRRQLEKLGYLYRYRSLEQCERVERTVAQSKCFFSTYEALNDPFDGKIAMDSHASPERIRSYWEAHLREEGVVLDDEHRARIQLFIDRKDEPHVQRELAATAAEETAKWGVLCLSERPDDIPMWAYYADSQKGVCLRFNVSKLFETDNRFVPFRVSYVKDYPRCGFYRDSRFRRAQVTMATKAHEWRHEREWRYIRERGGEEYDFAPGALDGIIMGCMIDPAHEARLRALVTGKEPKIELLRARPAERAFRLEIGPV